MGLENIIGKWPGDESDEQIEKAIKSMNTCLECERLRKELEDLRHAVDCDNDHIEAYHMVQAENDKLRERVRELEESQRWRKWPEEKPERQGSKYQWQVMLDHYPAQALFISGRWFLDELRSDDEITERVRYWRPIGELPKEQKGGGDE